MRRNVRGRFAARGCGGEPAAEAGGGTGGDGSADEVRDGAAVADQSEEETTAGVADGADGQPEAASADGAADAAPDALRDAPTDTGSEAETDASDGGDLGVGLVAYYKFDETSGTSAADSSGNGRTATLMGGATFSAGLENDAATLNGGGAYVSLPSGIVSGLTSFSICTWVKATAPLATWSRIFDFGTGTAAYMFLTVSSNAAAPRFSITTGGSGQEQQLNPTAALVTGSWQHVAVTLTANTGTLYVNGSQVAQNASMTLDPASLGTTAQDWLGRSEFAGDPYLDGQLDNFRIYDRALSATDVQALYAGHL
jgi:Concanavalin A-like lectin/glucanases superfamily